MNNLVLFASLSIGSFMTSVATAAEMPKAYGPEVKKTIVYETSNYSDGDTKLEGTFVYDKSLKGPRPGVLVVHDWMGPSDYTKLRAAQMASLGYAAFVADIYGSTTRPKDPKEAGAAAGKFKSDRGLLRKRVNLALSQFTKSGSVDSSKVAAIGYCFGGTTVLELARSGANVAGVASFHGGLDSLAPLDAKNINGKVLVLHGADDPSVSPDNLAAFEKELREAKVDWQLFKFGGSVHSFSNPAAGSDNSKGNAYNAAADKRSFEALKEFLNELFR